MEKAWTTLNTSGFDMRKFIIRLLGIAVSTVTLVGLTLVVLVCHYQHRFDQVLKPRPDQDVLFIGSSQIGCSIVESPKFHNKVLWTSQRPMHSVVACVHAMEELGFLEGVKVMVVRANLCAICAEKSESIKSAWFRELPISWCRMSYFPVSRKELFWHLATHLSVPIKWQVNQSRPTGKLPISQQTKEWKDNLYVDALRDKSSEVNLIPGWYQALLASYMDLASLCTQKGIRLVVVNFPCLRIGDEYVNETRKAWARSLLEDLKVHGMEVVEVSTNYPDSCYFDVAHMTEHGARQFTEELYSRLGIQFVDSTMIGDKE